MLKGTKKIRTARQLDWFSCGARCTQMVLWHFGRKAVYRTVYAGVRTGPLKGTRLIDIQRFLVRNGFRATHHGRLTLQKLENVLERGGLAITAFSWKHVVVVHGIDQTHVYLANPWPLSRSKFTRAEFRRFWKRQSLAVYLS